MRKFSLSNRMLFLIAAGGLVLLGVLYVVFLNSSPNYNPYPEPTLTKDEQQQAQDDIETAKSEKEFLGARPWYNKIPPANDKYFIGYDQRNNEFFVDLYSKTPAQEEEYKAEVLSALRSIGVDTTQYKISWSVATR